MGWPEVAENGRKIMNFPVVHDGRPRRFAGLISAYPAAVRREIPQTGSSGCGAPSRLARVTGGWPVVPRLVRSLTARNEQKSSTWFPVLESFFLEFLEFKKCLRARVSFGIPNYVYIGSRVTFG